MYMYAVGTPHSSVPLVHNDIFVFHMREGMTMKQICILQHFCLLLNVQLACSMLQFIDNLAFCVSSRPEVHLFATEIF